MSCAFHHGIEFAGLCHFRADTEAFCGFIMKYNHAGGILVLAFMFAFGVLMPFGSVLMPFGVFVALCMFMLMLVFMFVVGVRAARKSESRCDKKDM